MRLRFQYRRYRLPLRVAVRTAHGVWREREGLIVRLEHESGVVGYGEAAPIPAFGTETVDEAESASRELGEWGDDVRLAAVPARLSCLRNAIAAAQTTGVARAASGAVHEFIGVAALLPAGRAALSLVESGAESGFRVFKWKVGVGDVADELSLLDDLCAALPAGARLRLDANGAWDRRRAERWLERCAERPIEFVEQPIAADARGSADLLLGLAADYPTPLGLDESLGGEGDVERWLGDVAGALARLAKARAEVVFSSALETAVGAQAALRVAFAWPGASDPSRPAEPAQPRALGFGVWPLFVDRRFDGPAAAPFLRARDVERIDAEAVWTALT
jgi:O-succinylbenzoate synthase